MSTRSKTRRDWVLLHRATSTALDRCLPARRTSPGVGQRSSAWRRLPRSPAFGDNRAANLGVVAAFGFDQGRHSMLVDKRVVERPAGAPIRLVGDTGLSSDQYPTRGVARIHLLAGEQLRVAGDELLKRILFVERFLLKLTQCRRFPRSRRGCRFVQSFSILSLPGTSRGPNLQPTTNSPHPPIQPRQPTSPTRPDTHSPSPQMNPLVPLQAANHLKQVPRLRISRRSKHPHSGSWPIWRCASPAPRSRSSRCVVAQNDLARVHIATQQAFDASWSSARRNAGSFCAAPALSP